MSGSTLMRLSRVLCISLLSTVAACRSATVTQFEKGCAQGSSDACLSAARYGRWEPGGPFTSEEYAQKALTLFEQECPPGATVAQGATCTRIGGAVLDAGDLQSRALPFLERACAVNAKGSCEYYGQSLVTYGETPALKAKGTALLKATCDKAIADCRWWIIVLRDGRGGAPQDLREAERLRVPYCKVGHDPNFCGSNFKGFADLSKPAAGEPAVAAAVVAGAAATPTQPVVPASSAPTSALTAVPPTVLPTVLPTMLPTVPEAAAGDCRHVWSLELPEGWDDLGCTFGDQPIIPPLTLDGDTVYAVVMKSSRSKSRGQDTIATDIYRRRLGDLNFKKLTTTPLGPGEFNGPVVVRGDEIIGVVGRSTAYSADGGKTWGPGPTAKLLDGYDLRFVRLVNGEIIGVSMGRVYRLVKGAWLPLGPPSKFLIDDVSSLGKHLMILTADDDNRPKSFVLDKNKWRAPKSSDYKVKRAPANVVVSVQNGIIRTSRDGTKTWVTASIAPDSDGRLWVRYQAAIGKTVLIATGERLLRSDDNGAHWSVVPMLPKTVTVVGLVAQGKSFVVIAGVIRPPPAPLTATEFRVLLLQP